MPSPSGPEPRPAPASTTGSRAGLPLGIAAYVLWGGMPLYFPLMRPAGAVEVIAHRVVWTMLFCIVLVLATRTWPQVRTLLRSRRTLAVLAAAAVLLGGNWLVFVYGVLTGHTVDAALGYFINPIVTVGLAVLVLRERLRPAQWAALGIGTAAVVVIALGVGGLPWIALVLAVSFGGYGLLKSRLGATVGAVAGLTVETAVLTPFAVAALVAFQVAGTATFGHAGAGTTVALIASGVVTAMPLLLFNAAARRLPLSVLGLLQYITPTLQFLVGVLVQHETMPPARWWGFGLVWVALVVLSADGLAHGRRAARDVPTGTTGSPVRA